MCDLSIFVLKYIVNNTFYMFCLMLFDNDSFLVLFLLNIVTSF
jgi:hypothetical protein